MSQSSTCPLVVVIDSYSLKSFWLMIKKCTWTHEYNLCKLPPNHKSKKSCLENLFRNTLCQCTPNVVSTRLREMDAQTNRTFFGGLILATLDDLFQRCFCSLKTYFEGTSLDAWLECNRTHLLSNSEEIVDKHWLRSVRKSHTLIPTTQQWPVVSWILCQIWTYSQDNTRQGTFLQTLVRKNGGKDNKAQMLHF